MEVAAKGNFISHLVLSESSLHFSPLTPLFSSRDTYAAKRAGFRTAWVANEEHFTCPDVYGTPDIIGKDLEDVATQILAWEGKDAPQ